MKICWIPWENGRGDGRNWETGVDTYTLFNTIYKIDS